MLGPDHPDTLGSRDNLAIAYRAAGRAAEAIELHERTLGDMERVLGPDHPDTLGSRGNLAIAYRAAGRAAEAIPLYERTLGDMERVLGPDHPDTLDLAEQPRRRLSERWRGHGRRYQAPLVGPAACRRPDIPTPALACCVKECPFAPSPAASDCSPESLGTVREDVVARSQPGPFDNHDFSLLVF